MMTLALILCFAAIATWMIRLTMGYWPGLKNKTEMAVAVKRQKISMALSVVAMVFMIAGFVLFLIADK